jgi:DNA invertase Pin-like site-specific DNA recombinase
MCEMESDTAVYGYARVSTDGQSLGAQIAEPKEANCKKVFQEKISGARADRKQLARLMALLAKDDVLVVTRLDRLARSTRDLLNLLGSIEEKGAGFKSLRDTYRHNDGAWSFDANHFGRPRRV